MRAVSPSPPQAVGCAGCAACARVFTTTSSRQAVTMENYNGNFHSSGGEGVKMENYNGHFHSRGGEGGGSQDEGQCLFNIK